MATEDQAVLPSLPVFQEENLQRGTGGTGRSGAAASVQRWLRSSHNPDLSNPIAWGFGFCCLFARQKMVAALLCNGSSVKEGPNLEATKLEMGELRGHKSCFLAA